MVLGTYESRLRFVLPRLDLMPARIEGVARCDMHASSYRSHEGLKSELHGSHNARARQAGGPGPLAFYFLYPLSFNIQS